MTKANGFFKFIERNGFFIEFLIIDSLSCILPRTLVGLSRDKDKTGKNNYQAAAEELGREVLSGPTMNLIPMACAAVAINKFLPTVKLESETLEGVNNSLQNAVKTNSSAFATKERANKQLAGQIFDDAFGKNKGHAEYSKLKEKFVSLLETASTEKPKNRISRKIDSTRNAKTKYDIAEENFDNLVVEVNNKFSKDIAIDDPHQISLSKINKSTSSHTFFEDFHLYSKDVLDKFLKKDKSKSVEEFLKERASKAKLGKNVLAGLAFLVVGGFLLYLPKIYQLGKISPAQQSAKRA